ncbi:MAG: hypothetical protein ABI034_09170 [Nakamurella sp.]
MTHPGADAASAGSGVPQAVAENHAVEGSKAAADESAAEHAAEAEAKRDQARRRRRIDQIFGDVLPDTTSDEREPGHHGGFSLEHYRASKPPHWGEKL